MKRLSLLAIMVCSSWVGAGSNGPLTGAALEKQDLWATLSTTKGDIVVHLLSKEAPKTVANFVGLAMGEKEFTDPKTQKPTKRHFYDGLIFHRVIPEFMVQGGDPEGTGSGSPGYTFEDEFQSGRGFDKVGLMAMANRGPATNGSQFFLTTSTPKHLNGKHTIFGEIVAGYDVLLAISAVPCDARDRPLTNVVINKVTVSPKPPKLAPPPAAPKKGTPK